MTSLHRSSHGAFTVIFLTAALAGCWGELVADPEDDCVSQPGTTCDPDISGDQARVISPREILVPGRPEGDGVVNLVVGESATVGDVTVDFLKVLEDSRCPTGTMCVWEGQAVVALQAALASEAPEAFTLTLRAGHKDLASQIAARHRFTMLQLTPYPDPDIHIYDPSKYTLRLWVTDLRRSHPEESQP